MKDGGWTFISHSHKDIKQVRFIRNELEKRGFEPLMFYLKCLNDDDEIEDIIKREINERTWFIYVESQNSINSKWVKTEREYIKTLKDKKIFTIDITKDISEQLEKIENISRQMKIFISYTNKDFEIYNQIKNHLVKKDLLVFSEQQLNQDHNWFDNSKEKMEQSSRNGFVIPIITDNSINSSYMKHELLLAEKLNAKIIPVIIKDLDVNILNKMNLTKYNYLKISHNITKEELDNLYNKVVESIDC